MSSTSEQFSGVGLYNKNKMDSGFVNEPLVNNCKMNPDEKDIDLKGIT
jgi:hypothetical protein